VEEERGPNAAAAVGSLPLPGPEVPGTPPARRVQLEAEARNRRASGGSSGRAITASFRSTCRATTLPNFVGSIVWSISLLALATLIRWGRASVGFGNFSGSGRSTRSS
jgi:hypothetical protein